MFSASGLSPWWVTGLSGFMTIFSAATFVVWGGIAYELGIVALSINMCYGVASLAAGYFIASKWKKTGVHTPAEYISLRFGETAMHFYTWVLMFNKMTGASVAVYGLALLLTALMPLPDGHLLQDPHTGNLSVAWAIIIFGMIVVLYTMAGGLWSVLMTDVIQFLILTLSVIFIVPLMLFEVGGLQSFLDRAPAGFFNIVSGDYTWLFLAGWCLVYFFMIGADWAFAQRYISVANGRAARKSAYLAGALYLISPIIWLAPPMLYRVVDDSAIPGQAYILASQLVLPAGLLGMMVAAMFSATASAVSSQINVFAGGLTDRLYHAQLRPNASEKELVWAGRLLSLLLGIFLVAMANVIPYIGVTTLVVAKSSLIIGPMLAPVMWGLFSRKMSASTIWWVVASTLVAAFIVKSGLQPGGIIADIGLLEPFAHWAQSAGKIDDFVIGLVVPITVLVVAEIWSRTENSGWRRLLQIAEQRAVANPVEIVDPSLQWIVAITLIAISLVTFAVAPFSDDDLMRVLTFGSATTAVALVMTLLIVFRNRRKVN